MRISVIVPTYKRADLVCVAIDSILAQTRPADEIIVVDDGSPDHTAAVLAGFGDRIVVLRQENAGVNAARNAAIARATGDWLTFLDDDDVWLPNRLAVLERDLRDAPPGVRGHLANLRFVGPGYDWAIFEMKGITCPDGAAKLVQNPFFSTMGGLQIDAFACTPGLARDAGLFTTEIHSCADGLFFGMAALRSPWLFTNDVVAEVRRVEDLKDSITYTSNRTPFRRFEDRLFVLDRLAEQPDMAPSDRRILRDQQAFTMLDLAYARFRAGCKAEARKALVRAARLHPVVWKGWMKSLIPLVFGGPGFRAIFSRVKRFSRR